MGKYLHVCVKNLINFLIMFYYNFDKKFDLMSENEK